MAKSWEKEFTITASGFDVDFIWMACTVLWKRLAPDVINSEQLDDMMQEGYTLLESEGADKAIECCNVWLQVWDHLKSRFTEDMKDVEDTRKVFAGLQSLFNWCQDFEMELLNAGSSDPSFYQKRIDYCREFCSFFPDSDELLICNMKRAEAESYFMLGETEQGDQSFQALIEEFPDNAWGYIGWGDMYSTFCPRHMEKNLKKAKEIYEMALNIDSEERKHVVSRLESLDEEQTDESS
ncbi:MAG: tetratricopeptide repeat protein [Deltaproteobacteria bacterium]|nr:tetratricopeptide repeat protein [Deltaproteobacteria bacterium]